MRRKGIQVIPSAMTFAAEDNIFKSDGTRVAYLNANISLTAHETTGGVADRLRKKLLTAFDNDKIRVIPRENQAGNRLDLRRDIGFHFLRAEKIFPLK
jgi:hypothetical protein